MFGNCVLANKKIAAGSIAIYWGHMSIDPVGLGDVPKLLYQTYKDPCQAKEP